jgi:hypothetical protein
MPGSSGGAIAASASGFCSASACVEESFKKAQIYSLKPAP